jgi:3-deoxy-7-phosphoheptulonate synthase
VGPVAKAAIASGADGLMIEVHPHPEKALKDGAQSLTPAHFTQMMHEAAMVARAVGRYL